MSFRRSRHLSVRNHRGIRQQPYPLCTCRHSDLRKSLSVFGGLPRLLPHCAPSARADPQQSLLRHAVGVRLYGGGRPLSCVHRRRVGPVSAAHCAWRSTAPADRGRRPSARARPCKCNRALYLRRTHQGHKKAARSGGNFPENRHKSGRPFPDHRSQKAAARHRDHGNPLPGPGRLPSIPCITGSPFGRRSTTPSPL